MHRGLLRARASSFSCWGASVMLLLSHGARSGRVPEAPLLSIEFLLMVVDKGAWADRATRLHGPSGYSPLHARWSGKDHVAPAIEDLYGELHLLGCPCL